MSPRQDDDDQDTRPSDIMSPPRKPTVATSPSATQDASANGGPAADGAETSSAHDAGADTAAADAVPALPADGIGHALDAAESTVTFDRPESAPVPPRADDWVPGRDGEPSPDGSPAGVASAAGEPYPGSLASGTALRAESTTESSAPRPSPAAPAAGEPPPGTVSAAAFAWQTPGPAPVPPSSPARNFLRSGGNAKTATVTGAAAVGSASAAADRAAEPARGKPKRSSRRQARQAHLTVARIEPWSVMKFSFVVSLVAFVILFVAVSVLYGSLSALGVFDSLQRVVTNVTSSQGSAGVNAAKWFTASKVLGYTALLGSLNIVLITAMATIGAVVYNLTSRLTGGVEVTLRETE